MIGLVRPLANDARRVVFAVALVTATFFPSWLGAAQTVEIARYAPATPPGVSAKAVYVADLSTGTELFAQNPDEPLPPASLTKIVSALVILDHVDLDERITILEDDLVGPEESQVGLVAGDVLTARDLLYGVLIPSGNDATKALARHIGENSSGTTESPADARAVFVSLMNGKAQELGATSSHFANATGIDGDGHVMTARDVALFAQATLADPLLAEIVGTPSTVLESEVLPDGYPITTTNLLLLEGVATGVKTGSTPKAGGCLATTFLVGENEVIAVVLGSEIAESTEGYLDYSARFADARALISATTADYVWLDVAEPGVVSGLLDELSVWDVALSSEMLLPVPVGQSTEVRYRLVLDPPVAPEAPVGEIQFFVGETLLSERPALQID